MPNTTRSCGEKEKLSRIILDCDAGTDDAVALYQLLLAESERKVKIEMIVCSRGNTSLHNVCKNVVRLLESANRTDIPVYRGSYETFLPKTEAEEHYHGIDGFGDLSHCKEPNTSIIREDFAAVAMNKLINENPHEISLICVGPLTNLALLMRMYQDTLMNIKDIHIMGGNHLGMGNVSPTAEFNFHTDPEAAHVVFACAKCPIHLLTWECCMQTDISMDWRMNTLGKNGGHTWQLIDKAEKAIYKDMSANWIPCDAFLISAFLYPEIITKQQMQNVNVELSGKLTRGQAVIDHKKQKAPNTNVIEEIDSKLFQKIILKAYTQF